MRVSGKISTKLPLAKLSATNGIRAKAMGGAAEVQLLGDGDETSDLVQVEHRRPLAPPERDRNTSHGGGKGINAGDASIDPAPALARSAGGA